VKLNGHHFPEITVSGWRKVWALLANRILWIDAGRIPGRGFAGWALRWSFVAGILAAGLFALVAFNILAATGGAVSYVLC